MTMLIMDGCDNYNSSADTRRFWRGGQSSASITGQSTGGRFGGGRINVQNDDIEMSMALPGGIKRALFSGFAFDFANGSQSDRLMQFHENGTQQVIMQHQGSTGQIHFYRGSFAALLGSTTAGLISAAGAWTWVETFIAFSNALSEGYLECRINGTVALVASNIDTLAAGSGCNQIALYGQVANTFYDDIMVWDDLGSSNNDWLGDTRIDLIHPTADVGTPPPPPWHNPIDTDENYKMVDEQYRDLNNYVEANTLGQKDMYSCGPMPNTNPDKIHAIGAFHVTKKPDAGSRRITQIIEHGGVEDRSAAKYTNENWLYQRHIVDVNPSTGLAWTEAEVNAIAVGMELS